MNGVWTEKQKQAFAFFNENMDALAGNPLYRWKYLIISGDEVKGTFDSFAAALSTAVATYYKGDYIIHKIEPDDEPVDFFHPALASA